MDDYDGIEFDFSHYWRILKSAIRASYKKVLFISFSIGILAFLFTLTLQPQYRATAVMHVSPPKSAVFDLQQIFFNQRDPAFRETQVGIMRSRVLLNRVVEKLQLHKNPAFAGKSGSFISVLFGGNANPSNLDNSLSIEATSSILQRSLFVIAKRDSYLYDMSYISNDPSLAADITNAWTQAYLAFVEETEQGESEQSDTFLQERLLVVNKDLRAAEKKLQNFKENQGIVGGSVQSGGLVNQELDSVSQRLLDAKQKRLEAEGLYAKIVEIEKKTRNYQGIPAVKNDVVIQNIRSELLQLESQRGELSKRYGSSHRRIVEVNSQISAANGNLNRQVSRIISGIKSEYEIAKQNEERLSQVLEQSKTNIQSLGRKQSDLLALEQEVKSQREIYQILLGRLNQGRAEGDKSKNNDTFIVDPAVIPTRPISSKGNKIILLAVLLSLIFGFGIALLKEFFNNTIKIDADVNNKLSQSCLGIVPMIEHETNESANSLYNYFLEKKSSAFSESIRTLRSGLMLSSLDFQKRRVLFTSSIPSEGKTTLAINAAMSFGKLHKTLLIDCDLRRPSIDRLITNSERHRHVGLSDLCLGEVPASECIHSLSEKNIDVLCAGTINPNPQELFCSSRFSQLLNKLSEIYDVIIIDTPPSLGLSDTSLISSHVDQVVFVVKSADTSVAKVRASLAALKKANAPITGVVVNQVLPEDLNDSYYYDYGYATENVAKS